ncbi:MAG: hypothetical protein AAF985_27060, partial [Bacteroidota bacterium]
MKKIPFHFLDEVFVRAPIYTYRKNIDEEAILQLLDDPFFIEAIYVSSNGLYEKCIKLKNGQIDDPVEKRGIVFS